ncbi:hypothetical protein [Mucilaginibacter panaciglaebae]|uniref:Uncharacterized protein n=1 Tax=Mucilaginibacter panaciglaebae TaxID=502331 RepID=A0ABP7X052_9SPHI
MNSKGNSITVKVNYEILKDYHPLITAYHYILKEKRKISDIENIKDVISFDYMSDDLFAGIKDDLKRLFKAEYNLKNWRKHRDHFLFLTELFMRDEQANHQFKKQRIMQLREVVVKLDELRKMVDGNRGPRTLLINNTVAIDNYLTSAKVVKLLQEELTTLYNHNILDESLPKINDKTIDGVISAIRKPKLKTISSYDKTVGYLAFVLKVYLEEQAGLKGIQNNVFNKVKTIDLSNEQGQFIYSYLRLLNIIKHQKTDPQIVIRRYIEKFTNDIDFHYNAFQNE